MKYLYFNNIKNALKSKEYWFGFALIIISCILTALFNLSSSGIFNDYKIGSAEFFIAATMRGNTLLQISAPVIAIFVCMNRYSLFMGDNEAILKAWKNKEMKAHLFASISIGGSIFLFSFLTLLLAGIIIFPSSTGSLDLHYGLFKDLYLSAPIGYVFAYIMHSYVCGALFALFGFALKVLIVKPVSIVLFAPLVFYSSFISLGWVFRFLDGVISFISPLYTFDISSFDIPPLKRFGELSFILILSLTLIITSYYRNINQVKRESDKETEFNDSI